MKNTTNSFAKISRPVLKTVLLRKRLFSRLDESLDLRAVWISGPPGAGKTTLVSSYIESRDLQSLWYQVDSGDAEAATFFHYMGLAAKKAAPRRRKYLPVLTPEFLQRLPVFTRRFFQDLFGRLKTPSIVVLDNYQDALNNETFNGIIRDSLAEVPDGVTVIVLSHNDPPAVFARMRAYHQLELIGWEELRLTTDESKELASQKGGMKLSDKEVKDLHEKTQGWAAGLVLLLERMKVDGLGTELMSGPTYELIFDYFVAEIFGKFDSSTRNFLLQSALLPNLTVKMAKELTSSGNASSILSDLASQNCFTIRHVHNKLVHYQYHYLFRQFLLTKSKEELGLEHFCEIKVKAAGILIDNGQLDAAADLLVESNRWDNLVTLILTAAPEMIRDGRSATVERWMKSLPVDVFEKDPWLCYWMGSCRMPFVPAESIALFERAYEVFRKTNDHTGMVRAICGVLNSIASEYRDFKQSDRWINTLEGLLKKHPEVFTRELENQIVPSVFYLLSLRRPDHPDFDIWKERAHTMIEGKGDPSLQILMSCNLIAFYNWTGELTSSAMVLDTMKRIPLPSDTSSMVTARKIAGEQAYGFFSNDYEACLRSGEEGVKHARKSGVQIWEAQYHGASAAFAISYGDLQKGEELLYMLALSFKNIEHVNSLYISFYYLIKGYFDLASGEFLLARTDIEKGIELAEGVGTTIPLVALFICMAQVLHEVGNGCEAKQYLKKARAIGQSMHSHIIEFNCLAEEAGILFDHGDDSKGLKILSKALPIGAEKRLFNFFGWRHKVMARLCARALENGIEVDYVRELIKKRKLYPEPPPLDVEQWPWPLRIYTLGRFEVMIDDKPLKFSGKAPKKPMEMFKVLVAFGGCDVGEVQISDVLWPDADGDEAHMPLLQRCCDSESL